MRLFTRALKNEENESVVKNTYSESSFIQALANETIVTKETVMSIPVLARSINFIADTICMLDWHLYEKDESGNVKDICDDRCGLLNHSSYSNIKSNDVIKNMIIDYLVYGSAYGHRSRQYSVDQLIYIDPSVVSTQKVSMDALNPAFKMYVEGREVKETDFVILLNGTTLDGLQGDGGLISTNRSLIELAFVMTRAMRSITNGSKIIATTENKLGVEALNRFRNDIKRLIDSDAGTLVLNKGVNLTEIGRSSTDNQFVQIYQELQKQLSYILGVPMSILDGTCTDLVYNQTIKSVVLPIVNYLEKSISDTMLLEAEKGTREFKVDTNNLLRTSQKERYEAYKLAIEAGFLTRNEVRRKENHDVIEGLDTFVFGLGEILYNPTTGEYKNFNMDSTTEFSKGGEIDGD